MASPSRADHGRRKCAHRVDRSAQVHPESKVPVLVSRLMRRTNEINAGVAAQQIDSPVLATDTVGAYGPLPSIRNVEDQRQDDTAIRGEGRGGRFEGVVADIPDNHLHSGVQACAGDAKADAARPAGNEGNFVAESVHRVTPWVRRPAWPPRLADPAPGSAP